MVWLTQLKVSPTLCLNVYFWNSWTHLWVAETPAGARPVIPEGPPHKAVSASLSFQPSDIYRYVRWPQMPLLRQGDQVLGRDYFMFSAWTS